MQLAILLWAALFVAYTTITRYKELRTPANKAILICCILYALVCCVFSSWVISHYAMPLNDALYLCINELNYLSVEFHATYNIVNYAIFIMFTPFEDGNNRFRRRLRICPKRGRRFEGKKLFTFEGR